MTTQQYKYIKGVEVLSQEHMPSATELANHYGLLTMNGKPNAVLVTQIIADSFRHYGAPVDSYYYVHSHGVMKVYPRSQYAYPIECFIDTLKDGQEYNYTPQLPEKRIIKFKYKKP